MFRHKLLPILFVVFLFLNACSSSHRKDGPPLYPVDETKIPNAVPKVEPLSKLGNMQSYRVFGKRYYVMRSSKNYNEVGTASWYGTQFHKQRTSSGERYNMLAMTAAHKTLPLPTYAEVTNVKNGRKIIVKINDRGPFESNRIIDLSYVAAKKLGMLGHGTATVRVEAIDPVVYANRNTPHTRITNLFANNTVTRQVNPKSGTIFLQVGAFQNRLYAERLKKRILNITSTPVRIAQTHKLYRVQVGPILDVATADHISRNLYNHGLSNHKID